MIRKECSGNSYHQRKKKLKGQQRLIHLTFTHLQTRAAQAAVNNNLTSLSHHILTKSENLYFMFRHPIERINYQIIHQHLVLLSDVWNHSHDKLGRQLST